MIDSENEFVCPRSAVALDEARKPIYGQLATTASLSAHTAR